MCKVLHLDPGDCKRLEEIAELDRFVSMILNVHALGRGQNCASPVELRRVEAHAHVSDESTEHEDEVRGFDILADVFVAAHRTAINADVERMILRNGAFA